jgi:uncharacterized membrane protein YfcA
MESPVETAAILADPRSRQVFRMFPKQRQAQGRSGQMDDFLIFALIGFMAQLVDGALGMAFGVLSTTSLLAFGVPPATASAVTHVTEIFTTAASGTSHIGGAAGAFILSNVDGKFIEPFVSAYLAGIGFYILFKAVGPLWPREVKDKIVPWIGAGGGLLDAMGGGGWGPIVTGSLIGRGHAPRLVIGSTNLTEFLVTTVISATFILSLGWSELSSASGLILGGVIAAPLGGFLVSRIPTRPLMIGVGIIIVATSIPRIF